MFWVIDYSCLAIMLACALLVVRLRNLSGAVMALSAMGTVISLLFVVLGAPDDAHSEVVVGAIALPTMYLVAIGKLRTDVSDDAELGEEQGADARQ
jgi:energy-converting hydrogenase B subunit D